MAVPPESALDRNQAIAALEAQLARTPRAARPHEHAVFAYRLGLAYAESSGADDGLRKALALYEVAGEIFDPRDEPVAHARVLNAAGAAHRALAAGDRAADLFEQAAALFEGCGRDHERAAALSNLGLARVEAGDATRAVAAFDEALDLFDGTSDESLRGRATVRLNRGLARAASGTEPNLEAACADYGQARAELDHRAAPYHHALANHSEGLARYELAGLRPTARDELLAEAVSRLQASLAIFTRSAFPFQHALAKYNLGLAREGQGGADNLRHALACYEDAVALFDPRLHPGAWREAYAALERVEGALGDGASRTEHFVAMVAACEPEQRRALLRDRLTRLLALPAPARNAALIELNEAAAHLDPASIRPLIESQLGVLMELPIEELEAGLRSQLDAHRRLDPETRDRAIQALDAAIGDALGPPQRIFVRDYLSSLGYERP